MIASIFFIGIFLDFFVALTGKSVQAALLSAHSTCQAKLPRKTSRAPPGAFRNGCPVASQAIRQIAGQESGPRRGAVVKYRRRSLVFAKANMNPAAAGEPRAPR